MQAGFSNGAVHSLKKTTWGCTGFDARPARTEGKPNTREYVRWSREKQCCIARAMQAGFSSGAVHSLKKNNMGMYWF